MAAPSVSPAGELAALYPRPVHVPVLLLGSSVRAPQLPVYVGESRVMKLRFPGACAVCGIALDRGRSCVLGLPCQARLLQRSHP